MADTKAKRAPGENPALSFLLAGTKAAIVIVTVLVLLIVGWSVWRWYRPEHFLNPINRFANLQLYEARAGGRGSMIAHWSASMVPLVFAAGEPRVEVTRRLSDAGYGLWVDDGEDLIYVLRGGGTAALFVCGNDFLVRLKFDDADRLISAVSDTMGACL